eukprot:IDg7931t1
MNVIRYKYLFKVKFDSPEVRIVAMSCHKVHGGTIQKRFTLLSNSPNMNYLAIAAFPDLGPGQMDVITALLNGDLEKGINIEVPTALNIQSALELFESFKRFYAALSRHSSK